MYVYICMYVCIDNCVSNVIVVEKNIGVVQLAAAMRKHTQLYTPHRENELCISSKTHTDTHITSY